MPGGDRTGPWGMGPMTGRRAGYCVGFEAPGYANSVYGRGFGMGFGRGRGFRAGGFGRGWANRFYGGGFPGWAPSSAYEAPYYGRQEPYPYRTPDPEFEKQALKEQANALQSELDSINRRLSELDAAASDD